MAQTTKKTASTKSNAPALAYRTMQKPHATSYAGENDELTISHNAGLVAIINPQTKKKTIAVTVGTETTGLRKDGTPWSRHKNVILPVDTLESLITSLQAAMTLVQKHDIKAGVVYSASAVDLAFINQNQAEPEAEPVAQTTTTKAAGKNSAPAAAAAKQAKAEPETPAMTVAGWLAENAAEYTEAAEFIGHIVENEAGYQGKAVLRQAYNLLAEKFGKDKLQGQPALETVAQHIAAVFFKPKAKPAAKPEVQAAKPAAKPAAAKPGAAKPTTAVNAADLPEDEDEDLGTQLPDFDLADVDLLF